MDLLTTALDAIFLLLALVFFPRAYLYPAHPGNTIVQTPPDSAASASAPPSASAHTTTFSSHLTVPSITVTPSHPAQAWHKRKSVSFSLTPAGHGDLVRSPVVPGKQRPPTPFVRGPVSPSQSIQGRGGSDGGSAIVSPAESVAGTPLLGHSPERVDPMGVKKQWLMA